MTQWLQSNPAQVRVLHYDAHATQRLAKLLGVARGAGIALQATRVEMLNALAGGARHQGIVAVAMPFPYVELEHLLRAAPRLLIVADQIQDPHNLGALLRTAEGAGAGGVIIPKDGSVGVTATVEASAAGAAALVPVSRVTNAARAVQMLKSNGYWSIALTPRADASVYDVAPPEPVVVVVGGESGLRPLVSKQCDFVVSIPMYGRTESLNASVAAAVAVFELRRRWDIGKGTRPSGPLSQSAGGGEPG